MHPIPAYATSGYVTWGLVVRKAKLGEMRFHDLRHTSASLLLVAAIHPKVVSERLGQPTDLTPEN